VKLLGSFCLVLNYMNDFEKVFSVFRKNYKQKFVPLEVFGKNKYKTLISTILSARTNDDVTYPVSLKLFKKAPHIQSLNKLTISQINKIIKPINFYNNKSKYLKGSARIITEELNGKIPGNREGLMKLPGVGRKTANLVLNRSFNFPAIAVDTHVHRITNLLGWVNTNKPESTEKELTKILSKKYWSSTNRFFVSIGRQHTTKKRLEDFLVQNKLIKKQ